MLMKSVGAASGKRDENKPPRSKKKKPKDKKKGDAKNNKNKSNNDSSSESDDSDDDFDPSSYACHPSLPPFTHSQKKVLKKFGARLDFCDAVIFRRAFPEEELARKWVYVYSWITYMVTVILDALRFGNNRRGVVRNFFRFIEDNLLNGQAVDRKSVV